MCRTISVMLHARVALQLALPLEEGTQAKPEHRHARPSTTHSLPAQGRGGHPAHAPDSGPAQPVSTHRPGTRQWSNCEPGRCLPLLRSKTMALTGPGWLVGLRSMSTDHNPSESKV